jgi:hypothetical protein
MEDDLHENTTLDRREFTLAAALAALSGVAITITGCGGGSGSSPTAPSTPPPSTGGGGATADKTGAISSNHGHRAVVTGGQLTAADAVSLDIRGDADHPHTVVLTAAEVASIAGNQRVSKESSSNSSHSHTVTFN